jgi:hypothetical protein
MMVVVAAVGGVPLPLVQVVDVIAVRHRGVSAAGLVPVVVALDGQVLHDLAFRPLPLPLAVHVTVVGVVDVVGVLERHVPAALAVLVAVVVVDVLGGHRILRRGLVVRAHGPLRGGEAAWCQAARRRCRVCRDEVVGFLTP